MEFLDFTVEFRIHINGSKFVSILDGISASLMRQLTYTTTRFAVYEISKQQMTQAQGDQSLSFLQKVLLSGISGIITYSR
jgi:hypothetical protein